MLYKWLLFSFLSMAFLGSRSDVPASSNKVCGLQISRHPFFISVTEINHSSKEKELDVTARIFADDFEQTLKQNYKTKVDLSNPALQAQMSPLVHDYIVKHLQITLDGKRVSLQYVGFEQQAESVYCYFEVASVAAVKHMEVWDSLLQDFSNQQINIIHTTFNGKRQSYKLDYPQMQASFSF